MLTPISTTELQEATKYEQVVAKAPLPNAVTNGPFGNSHNCTINVLVYNNLRFQQCTFQGMGITTQEYVDFGDDQLVDSILYNRDYVMMCNSFFCSVSSTTPMFKLPTMF